MISMLDIFITRKSLCIEWILEKLYVFNLLEGVMSLSDIVTTMGDSVKHSLLLDTTFYLAETNGCYASRCDE